MGSRDGVLNILKEIRTLSHRVNERKKLLCKEFENCKGCPFEGYDCNNLAILVNKRIEGVSNYTEYLLKIGEFIKKELLILDNVKEVYLMEDSNTLYSKNGYKLFILKEEATEDVSVEFDIEETLALSLKVDKFATKEGLVLEVEVVDNDDVEVVQYAIDYGDYSKIKRYKRDGVTNLK